MRGNLPARLRRGSLALCIPVTGSAQSLERSLASATATSGIDLSIVVATEEPTPELERIVDALDREVHLLALPGARGPVSLANAALAACADADAVLLSSHTVVPAGWLERLRGAAGSDSVVATASALGTGTGTLSIGPADAVGADAARLDRLAGEVGARSPQARPRAATADGDCVWISRAALELEGMLDETYESLRAAVIDFSQRCLLRGLANVAVDDLLVGSARPESGAGAKRPAVGRDGLLLRERYPYLTAALEPETWQPLRRSLSGARRALGPLRVTIDARIVRGSFSGAHAQTLEIIETLDRFPQVRVRALLDPAIGRDALAVLDRLSAVERLAAADVPSSERDDIVHRPYQVTSAEDLELLSLLGERLVITHLDLIAFHNPGYFDSHDSWLAHRRLTRQALAMADRVVFLSDYAARDAMREELVEPERARVMPMAVSREQPPLEERMPDGAPERPFVLCLGNDFRHKNRLFAIRLLDELRQRGWEGDLVLAGARVEHGSSRPEEAAFLSSRPRLAAAVHDLPAVNEAEKAWLYRNAAAVAYPSVLEGFGLIPFEAARAGKPCLFAAQASLAEVLPSEAATIVPWDPAASAERALPLLLDADARRRHLELVAEAGRELGDWDSIARDLLALYEETAALPSREASLLAADASRQEPKLEAWNVVERGLSPQAKTGLLSLAQRRRLRRPLSLLLAGLYRVAGRGDRDGEDAGAGGSRR